MKNANTVILALGIGLWASIAQATDIKSINWITGHWTGTYQGLPMEAHYSNSDGGMILGMTKVANGQKAEFFEFEQIAEVADSLILRPFPFANKGVEFPLKELTGTRVVFENPTHEFPTRIIYELKLGGELRARIEGTQNGQPASDEFIFVRAE